MSIFSTHMVVWGNHVTETSLVKTETIRWVGISHQCGRRSKYWLKATTKHKDLPAFSVLAQHATPTGHLRELISLIDQRLIITFCQLSNHPRGKIETKVNLYNPVLFYSLLAVSFADFMGSDQGKRVNCNLTRNKR